MTFDKASHKEIEDAQEAKDKADPAIADPAFMPNIVPQTGDDDDSTPAERATSPEATQSKEKK